jgi:hypothetical protein
MLSSGWLDDRFEWYGYRVTGEWHWKEWVSARNVANRKIKRALGEEEMVSIIFDASEALCHFPTSDENKIPKEILVEAEWICPVETMIVVAKTERAGNSYTKILLPYHECDNIIIVNHIEHAIEIVLRETKETSWKAAQKDSASMLILPPLYTNTTTMTTYNDLRVS